MTAREPMLMMKSKKKSNRKYACIRFIENIQIVYKKYRENRCKIEKQNQNKTSATTHLKLFSF